MFIPWEEYQCLNNPINSIFFFHPQHCCWCKPLPALYLRFFPGDIPNYGGGASPGWSYCIEVVPPRHISKKIRNNIIIFCFCQFQIFKLMCWRVVYRWVFYFTQALFWTLKCVAIELNWCLTNFEHWLYRISLFNDMLHRVFSNTLILLAGSRQSELVDLMSVASSFLAIIFSSGIIFNLELDPKPMKRDVIYFAWFGL